MYLPEHRKLRSTSALKIHKTDFFSTWAFKHSLSGQIFSDQTPICAPSLNIVNDIDVHRCYNWRTLDFMLGRKGLK